MPSAPDELPLLYSFRRCPYAIRARMALLACSQRVRIREVLLRDKPAELLAVSGRATVPVMVLPNGDVLGESLDIMHWALARAGRCDLGSDDPAVAAMIAANDQRFKPWLDRYKYFDRYPPGDQISFRTRACEFIDELESRLRADRYLLGEQASLADYAVVPFVRQFAAVDRQWFEQSGYRAVQRWLAHWLQHPLFVQAMEKYPRWLPGDREPVLGVV